MIELVAANETMRLFVAVFPPAEVTRQLAEAARGLASGLSTNAVAWTRAENIHLTLNFLGNLERAKVEAIAREVQAACKRRETHLLQARGLGCFPSPTRPRVIWAGLDGSVAVLSELKRILDENLASLGYTPETRPFQPHLTLGRVKLLNAGDRRHLAAALPAWREAAFGPWTVERVDLMQSVLSPDGAEYTHIQSFPLPGTGSIPSVLVSQSSSYS
jgi:2'-5' RNA ligase